MPQTEIPDLPSLDVIRAELDVERADQERRNDSADTRAGVVLGFAGVTVGVGLAMDSLLALPGVIVSGIAAVLTTSILWPQPRSSINVTALRNIYVAAPAETTKLIVLDTRLKDQEFNDAQTSQKTKRLSIRLPC